jgi:lipopolysaccharide export LptBFGC system permease protein LptF
MTQLSYSSSNTTNPTHSTNTLDPYYNSYYYYNNNSKKKYKTYELFFGFLLVTGVVLLILGAVFWAQGNWQVSVGCDITKAANEVLGIYTTNELDALYAGCQAEGQAQIRWSKPLCISGAAIFTVMFVLILPIMIASHNNTSGSIQPDTSDKVDKVDKNSDNIHNNPEDEATTKKHNHM